MSKSLNFHVMPSYLVIMAEQPHRDSIRVHLAQYPGEYCPQVDLKTGPQEVY